MNEEKMRSLIARKEEEIKALEEKNTSIRNSVTDADYSEFERKYNKKIYFFNKLPNRVINKLRPIWDKATKLRTEIECIKKMLEEESKEHGD